MGLGAGLMLGAAFAAVYLSDRPAVIVGRDMKPENTRVQHRIDCGADDGSA